MLFIGSFMRSARVPAVAALLSLAGIARLAAGTPTVSPEVFDQIIVLLNERPDVPPALEPRDPTRPAKASKAAELCRLELRDIVYSVPQGKPAPELGPDRSTYEITKARQPVLLDPRASIAAEKGGAALFIATHVMAVNSDGSPRSN